MSEEAFRAQRRQKFLTKKYFELNKRALSFLSAETMRSISNPGSNGDLDPFKQGGLFKDKLKVLRLHYTAGDPIEFLVRLYAEAMKWFGEWHRAYTTQIQALANESGDDLRTDGTPLPPTTCSTFNSQSMS